MRTIYEFRIKMNISIFALLFLPLVWSMTLMDQSNLEIDYDFGVTATTIIMDDAEDLELGIN